MEEPTVLVLFDLSDTLVNGESLAKGTGKYQLMDGARELVESLSPQHCILGVVTSDDISLAESSLGETGLKERFSFIIGSNQSPTQEGRLRLAIDTGERAAAEKGWASIDDSRIFCIDDRPNRAADAAKLNLKFIGVAVDVDKDVFKMIAANATAVVSSLKDTKEILAVINSKDTELRRERTPV